MSAPTITLPFWALSRPILAAIECHVRAGIAHTAFPSMKAQDDKLLAEIEAMKAHLNSIFGG